MDNKNKYLPTEATLKEIYEIALEAPASVSSVRSVFRGKAVRGRLSARILHCIIAAGYQDLVATFETDPQIRAEIFNFIKEGRPKPYTPWTSKAAKAAKEKAAQ